MGLDQPIIVDTDFLSDYLAGANSAKKTMYDLLKEGMYIVTTVITASELYFGSYRRKWQQKRVQILEQLLSSLIVLPFTKDHTNEYGKLRALLVDQGIDIGFADTVIAAIAKIENIPVLTANIKHFERIEELTIRPYLHLDF